MAPRTAAQKQEYLHTLDSFFLQRIHDLFDLFFDETQFRLLQAAQQTASNQEQAQILETLSQLKRQRKTLESDALAKLQTSASANPALITTPTQPLALVEHDVFEVQLRLDIIVRRAGKRWFQPLYCLAKRYSILHDKTIEMQDLPVGVNAIGNAIHIALQTLIPIPLLRMVLQAFDNTVLLRLGDIYDALNERLKQWDILPNLEIELWRELHQGKIARPIDPIETDIADADSVNMAPADSRPKINSDELFNAAQQILQLIRGTSTAASDAAPVDNRDAVLAILEVLQHETAGSAQPLLQRLREHNAADEAQSSEGIGTDALRFVDTLFAELETALGNAPALAESLRQLHIPLARAAVQQPELLGDAEHPVHQFINLLTALTANADLPNAPLEQKLSGVVTPVAANSTGSQQIFAAATADLAPLIAQQNKARERNIRRIVDTYQGQQQLAHAHAAVDRELLRRNSNSAQMPALVLKLLERGWRHLLTLTYMRNGENSDEWSEYLALLDELRWRLGSPPSQSTTTAPEIAEQQNAASELAERIGHQLDHFFPGDYRNASLTDELRDALLGATAIETVDAPGQPLPQTHSPRELQLELDQAYPHLVRWFRRARDFNIGDEFVHFKDPTLRERYTLVWIGDNQQHFVFVNARGHKVFDFDLADLANEMAKGLHPVGHQAEWPAIEQAMLGTANGAYQQLAFNSTHDELTGLINRKEFEHQLGDALLEAKNNQLQHALLYIDIDQFSLINNLLGHVIGDNVLTHVSGLLAEKTPSLALLARTGGNEFAALLKDCNIAQAHSCAETICRSVSSTPYAADSHHLNITVSVGVVAINKYVDGTVTILRDAIAAANTAKELGRNRAYVLQSDIELHSRREKLLTWIDKMNDLLDSDYLVLRAQPIQCIADTGAIQHYEILLGLRDQDGTVTPPGEFIEAAECYNRMQRVDRWVIERAFSWLAQRAQDQQFVPRLSINLSGNSINDASFLDFLVDQFGSHRVAPNSICFEITETAAIKNLTNAADFMHQIKKIGCTFALDDFGTGLSSYEYLKHLPIDYLKIDGMFIVDIDKSPNDYAMVKSINEIAHFMGKQTIAEFVESENILDSLQKIGIDFAQGYHVGQPTLLSELYS